MMQGDLDGIRSGLTAYIGSLQNAVDLHGWERNQYVVSVLMDEIIHSISQVHDDNPYCEPFILVPVFSAMQGILTQQIARIKNDPSTEEDPKSRIERYSAMIGELTHLAEYGMRSRKDLEIGEEEKD